MNDTRTSPDLEALVADGAMSVPNAAAFLGVGRTLIYQLMGTGELRFLRIGTRRLIPRVELQRFLAVRLAGET